MNEKILATLKSSDTDDWVDIHIVRPLAYYFAVFFAKFDMHPNTVTIWSMIIGAISGYFFLHGSFYYEGSWGLAYNVIGLSFLLLADVLDCADGQLARLTHKSSRIGRILDGMAGYPWYLSIYVAICFRVYNYHSLEFGWFGIPDTEANALICVWATFVLGCLSGFVCMATQCSVADYYIQAHLFFLKGEKGSELDNSVAQQKEYDSTPWKGNRLWKIFQMNYITYTKRQEARTPEFQRLMALLTRKYGSIDNVPTELRQQFLTTSKAILPWNGMLTFNFRTFGVFTLILLDLPLMGYAFEIVALSLLAYFVVRRHESLCRTLSAKIEFDK